MLSLTAPSAPQYEHRPNLGNIYAPASLPLAIAIAVAIAPGTITNRLPRARTIAASARSIGVQSCSQQGTQNAIDPSRTTSPVIGVLQPSQNSTARHASGSSQVAR